MMTLLYLCTTANISRDEIDRLYIAVENKIVFTIYDQIFL